MPATVAFYKSLQNRYDLGNQIVAFIDKLASNPESPSLHVERVANAADKRVRTARVTDKYRAVLFELQGSGEKQFLVIDILNHDDAYDLATSKSLVVNAVTGVTQLVDVSAAGAGGAGDGGAGTAGGSAGLSQAEIESRAKAIAAQKVAEYQAQQAATDAAKETARADSKDAERPAAILGEHGITAEQLRNELGLSPQVVALIEEASSLEQLEKLWEGISNWERDATLGLLSGMSIAEVRADLQLDSAAESDEDTSATSPTAEKTGDDDALIAGMQTPAGRMDFLIDPGQEELEEIINGGSFAQWRVFLHPSQRRAVTARHSGSARITGGAGTGKTVVVIHRTKHLLDTDPGSRVLLTTFTRELANALKGQMNELDPSFPEASVHGSPGLWISGIDALVRDVLKNAQKSELRMALKSAVGIDGDFCPGALDGRTENRLWIEAADLKGGTLSQEKKHPAFLAQEYSAVILTHAIKDEKSYLRVRRAGRGTSLNRAERKTVWSIVELFQAKCAAAQKLTYAACAVVAGDIVEQRSAEGMFDHVLIDEAQDFHAGHWRFLRAIAKPGPNDIFISEDSHQRIYGQRLVLRNYGIETRGRATTKLRVNYRTTAQNLGYASAILDGTQWVDSEEQTDDLHGYHSVRQGPAPVTVYSESKAEEAEKIAAHIAEWTAGEAAVSIGVLARTNSRRAEISAQLAELGIAVSPGRFTTADRPVTVMTMFNAKGLEFTHVVLVDVSAEALPQQYLLRGLAPAEVEDSLQRERALLYVAASRARDMLLVSVVGKPSELLPEQLGEPDTH
ncbi:3'-5' exonuclease [Corynebacterium flavescens]|uniref:3'-5' exonuclease n=1 Tax=Corynebacterium flavescens TaxID=28028 RepID=UPI003FD28C91